MIRLAVIADDITGAADTAVQFSRKGIRTIVVSPSRWPENAGGTPPASAGPADLRCIATRPEELFRSANGYDVVVINTQSRYLSPTEASGRVAAVTGAAKSANVPMLYKKTDSTLRGNIAAELDAARVSFGWRTIAYIPAFPRAGRIVRGSILYVGGKPISETVYGADSAGTAQSDNIVEMLENQGISARGVSPDRTSGRSPAADQSRDFEGIIVFDASTDSQLERISSLLAAEHRLGLTAGPAGFAEVLASRLSESIEGDTSSGSSYAAPSVSRTGRPADSHEGAGNGPRTANGSNRPVLIVSGSVTDVALKQIDNARCLGFAAYSVTNPDWTIESIVTGAIRDLRDNRDVLIRTVSSRSELRGFDDGSARSEILARLSESAMQIIGAAEIGTLALFGGETAYAVLTGLRCECFVPISEIAPGVALVEPGDCRPDPSPGVGLPRSVVLKSGGHGPADIARLIKTTIDGG